MPVLDWTIITSFKIENILSHSGKIFLGSILLVFSWFLVRSTSSRSHGLPYYKGPTGLPLIGNLHQLGEMQWLKYTEWQKTYGPIFRLSLAGQHVLVISNAKIASDLMERRSSIYSDRPRFIMASEILTGGLNLAFAPYGDQWRRMRKAASDCLSAKAAQEYTPLQERECLNLLRSLLHVDGKIDPCLRRTAAAMILGAVYAYPPIEIGDPVVQKVENYVDRMLKAALPGNYMVDIFPWMKYLPSWAAKWKREGYSWFKKDTDLFLGLIDDSKVGLKSGTRSECFVAKLIESGRQSNIDEVERAWLAGMMFGAGGEAMAATLSVFMLAMVLYPRVQEKLRAEIERVVGKNCLVKFHEIKDLPYLAAVIKETLRWRPMGPLVIVPHRLIQDDVYDGHFIPKGTLIIPNIWAMHHDEVVYPDAKEFIPERFLSSDGSKLVNPPDTKDFGHHSYGFGRRSCLGYTIANNALILNAANIVLAFNICKAKDHNGQEISPDPNAMLDEGLAVRPEPFDCALKPRSETILALIDAHVSNI